MCAELCERIAEEIFGQESLLAMTKISDYEIFISSSSYFERSSINRHERLLTALPLSTRVMM